MSIRISSLYILSNTLYRCLTVADQQCVPLGAGHIFAAPMV